MKLKFSRQNFWKILKQFHESLSGGAELFHVDRWTDRQTDMTKLTVAFCNFANVPKNPSSFLWWNIVLYNKKRIKKNFQISTWQLQKRKNNLLQCICMQMILINPWLGTQHRLSMSKGKVPSILKLFSVISGSWDFIVSILTSLQTGQPRRHTWNPSRGKRLFASPNCPNQIWNPHNLLFNGCWR
jgi:hypothetical protein